MKKTFRKINAEDKLVWTLSSERNEGCITNHLLEEVQCYRRTVCFPNDTGFP